MLKLDYPEFLLAPWWWYLVVIPLEVINERGHISHVLVSLINMGCPSSLLLGKNTLKKWLFVYRECIFINLAVTCCKVFSAFKIREYVLLFISIQSIVLDSSILRWIG